MRCFHWLCFSDWLPHLDCFFHNVSAVLSSGLLQEDQTAETLWKKQPRWGSQSEKHNQQNLMSKRYILSFDGGTLLLREMMTMWRSREVICRRQATFWYMIHDPVSVIIPAQKKKVLFFDSPSYIQVFWQEQEATPGQFFGAIELILFLIYTGPVLGSNTLRIYDTWQYY